MTYLVLPALHEKGRERGGVCGQQVSRVEIHRALKDNNTLKGIWHRRMTLKDNNRVWHRRMTLKDIYI
jgi:hypothetical protein